MKDTKDYKPVFDMTPVELEQHLRPLTEKAITKRFDMNLPISYQDERCTTSSHFIHEYKDGQKFLVKFNDTTRESAVVKQLHQ